MWRDNKTTAKEKHENAKQLLEIKEYQHALSLYIEATELNPRCAIYFAYKARCLIGLNRPEEALVAATKSIQLDEQLCEGYRWILRSYIALGNFSSAQINIKKYNDLNLDKTKIENELKCLEELKKLETEANEALQKKDYKKVEECVDKCITKSPNCFKYKVIKAESSLNLGETNEADMLISKVLKKDPKNFDAMYIKALSFYHKGDINESFKLFQNILREEQDHKKAKAMYRPLKELKKKKEAAEAAVRQHKYDEAKQHYTEAIANEFINDRSKAQLYLARATVCENLQQTQDAISDYTNVLRIDPNNLQALICRGKCFNLQQEFEEAVCDFEKACSIQDTPEHRKLRDEAKNSLDKTPKKKDYYKILGVERNANQEDIKRAYRRLAKVYHPDRHSSDSEDVKKRNERKFKDLQEAYSVLGDATKRRSYDIHGRFTPTTNFEDFFNDLFREFAEQNFQQRRNFNF